MSRARGLTRTWPRATLFDPASARAFIEQAMLLRSFPSASIPLVVLRWPGAEVAASDRLVFTSPRTAP
jgi:hypothetical protein